MKRAGDLKPGNWIVAGNSAMRVVDREPGAVVVRIDGEDVRLPHREADRLLTGGRF